MKASEITIGAAYTISIGSRLATVTVTVALHRRHGERQRYACLTHDTDREIVATAARLRPVGGRPAENMDKMPLDRDGETAIGRAAAAGGWASAAALADHLGAWVLRLPGEGVQADAHASILRALHADPAIVARETWEEIAHAGRRLTSGAPFSRPAAFPSVGLTHLNRDREVESLVGVNLAVIERIVGGCHVADSLLTVCRSIRDKMGRNATRRVPVPLRRGLWQTAARLHAANRAEYREVMGHAPLPAEAQITAAMLACR